MSVTRKVYGGKRNVAEKTSSSTLAEKRQVGARVGGGKGRWGGRVGEGFEGGKGMKWRQSQAHGKFHPMTKTRGSMVISYYHVQ